VYIVGSMDSNKKTYRESHRYCWVLCQTTSKYISLIFNCTSCILQRQFSNLSSIF